MNQLLAEASQAFGLMLNQAQLEAFATYQQELLRWNERVNLTRIVAPEDIVMKHFVDSLSLYPRLAKLPPGFSLIDVGSGPGFPGVPLKIALPEVRLTLLESTGKKTEFLEHLVPCLSLTETTVLHMRAEKAGQQAAQREQYQVAVARAVAALPTLVEYMLPLVQPGGLAIAQKGQDPAAEVEAAATALDRLGGRVVEVQALHWPGLEAERHLVIIEKIHPTPPKYPRRSGMPAKRPL